MGLLGKRLMKWREPKMKGMVTATNMVFAVILILILSVPFGYLGGNGKFNISTWLTALGFLAAAPISLLIQPLLPGTLVQLREDMIVVGLRGTTSLRSAYKDIGCIYYARNCTYSVTRNVVKGNNLAGRRFTHFQVVNKNEGFYSVRQFRVPDNVKLEQVLQIFRDKGVEVIDALHANGSVQ